MEKHTFTELLQKYVNNECTPAEVDRLMELLEKDNYQAQGKAFISEQLDATAPAVESDAVLQERLEKRLAQVMLHINTPVVKKMDSRRFTTRWVAVAAMVILLLGSATFYWLSRPAPPATMADKRLPVQNDAMPGRDRAVLTLSNGQQVVLDSSANGLLTQQGDARITKTGNAIVYSAAGNKNKETIYNTMTTPRGGQYQLTLPDGTQVWLNAASSIRYPVVFTGNERRVLITGEVYFEVQKNATMPFKVNVNDREEVEVLGTHFNINAYDDEPAINTTLLEGKVKLAGKGNKTGQQQPTVLAPGQQAQLVNQNEPVRIVNNADIEQVMAWKNHLFKFDNADLKKVMRQLARWYDVEVSYENNAPLSEVFFGEMQTSLNLSQVLKGLGGMGVHFRIEGRKLVVMP